LYIDLLFSALSMNARRFQLFVFLACPLMWTAALEQPHFPIQAKLVRALQVGRVKVGDPVFAKVQIAWQGTDCNLREGAILRGHVVAQTLRSKISRTSEVSVLFDGAECDGIEMKPLSLTLAALQARDPRSDPYAYESLALSSQLGSIQHGYLDRNDPGHAAFRPSQALPTRIAEPMRQHGPQSLKPGDVLGINGVKLSVGSGPEGSSVIFSSRSNLNLEAATQMVLVPNTRVLARATAVVSTSPAKPPASEPVIDETEVCAPPACSIALNDSEATTRSALNLPIRNLGFPALPTKEMSRFDHEAAVAYLSSDQLLVTFNPHTLVVRPGLEADARTVRVVRGALIDVKTSQVKKIIEWRISDDQQYLWLIGAHRILIHAGRELKLYGPTLKLEQSFALDGPLAFVSPSPSGAHIAFGVIHERHSEEVHRQLREAEDQEPEEDINVRVLDAAFKTVISVNRSSRAHSPVLLDDGEVQTLNAGGTRWQIVDTDWKGEQRVLAKMTSACRPETSSLPPNLLFVIGCDIEAYGRWYRVLRVDGRTVLKGKSTSDELEQSASGSSAGANFAIGVAKVAKPRMANDIFHAADLKAQYIGVYGGGNGRKLLAVNIQTPLPTLQTFALSADGSQLAVLDGDHIALFQLPVNTSSSSR
jgi:hypothetical protein